MREVTEEQLRACFVNATDRELEQLPIPGRAALFSRIRRTTCLKSGGSDADVCRTLGQSPNGHRLLV